VRGALTLTIPDQTPAHFLSGPIPTKARREIVRASGQSLRALCTQLGDAFRPLPAPPESAESKLAYTTDLMAWLDPHLTSQPATRQQVQEYDSNDLPVDVRLRALQITLSEFDRVFTPPSHTLVIAAGFVIGEVLRSCGPQLRWDLATVRDLSPANRLVLTGFGSGQHYDPRRNFFSCAWQVSIKRERGPDRVAEMCRYFVECVQHARTQ
jgi:hypothetical protein